MMKVIKFGSSCLADGDAVKHTAEIIRNSAAEGQLCVVVSSLKDVSDTILDIARRACLKDTGYREQLHLLKMRHAVIFETVCEDPGQYFSFLEEQCGEIHSICDGVFSLGELSMKVRDRLLSFGPICGARLVTLACLQQGMAAYCEDSREFIVTDPSFGNAHVDFESTHSRLHSLDWEDVPIRLFAGFVGRCSDGRVTTIGRDGGDYTASIIAAALDAHSLELWTDVDGVMTADSSQVPDARPIVQMSYEEAMELSHFGARVVHSPTMQPAMSRRIPVRVRNSLNPSFKGTLICEKGELEPGMVTGISTISNVTFVRLEGAGMVGVRGVAGRLFTVLAQEDVNLIMISQGSSEHSICFAILPNEEDRAVDAITREFFEEIGRLEVSDPVVEREKCVLGVVGEHMRRQPGIAGRLFSCIGDAGINILAIAQGSSEMNISIVLDAADERLALNAIHSMFF